jgi:hypothetical protein
VLDARAGKAIAAGIMALNRALELGTVGSMEFRPIIRDLPAVLQILEDWWSRRASSLLCRWQPLICGTPIINLGGRTPGLDLRTPLLTISMALRCSRCGKPEAHCKPEPYKE